MTDDAGADDVGQPLIILLGKLYWISNALIYNSQLRLLFVAEHDKSACLNG